MSTGKMKTKEAFVKEIAERLRDTRIDRQMTQYDLAEKLGVHVEQISRWESGKHNLSLYTAAQLAEALDAYMDDLYLVE